MSKQLKAEVERLWKHVQELKDKLMAEQKINAQWIRRGNIPVKHWQGLLKMADEKKLKVFLQTIYQMCIDGK